MRKWILFLSLFFVFFSFFPSFYELLQKDNLPPERTFELVHNYLFDYNFYLSRIKEGQEGRWLVVEKYYNQPHGGSFFQIFYLCLGKLGGLVGFEPPLVYHLARIILGFILLFLIGKYALNFFPKKQGILAYLLVVTGGSWPILVKVENFYRFATYMGWWSAIDSLQRITFLPHVLFGQIFLLLFIWRFSEKLPQSFRLVGWGVGGFVVGIVFPPTLVVVYAYFAILSLIEILTDSAWSGRPFLEWIKEKGIPRLVFFLFSLPSLIYLQLMFKVLPWRALALFDVEHRMPLPYREYFLALGPILPLGILGGLVVLCQWQKTKEKDKERKLRSLISWILAIFLLFAIFERVPTQSPLRFTEGAIHIPLGILSAYFLGYLSQLGKWAKKMAYGVGIFTILLGLGVMLSMVGWLTDQIKAKAKGTWQVPIGAQLVYPLRDFMDGINYFRDKSKKEEVVLSFVTAGNYIPAYAGNFVYLGHANTPEESKKEKIAEKFFAGKMSQEEAREFLQKERISYLFFGPQEKEIGNLEDLASAYPFLEKIYRNARVIIYRYY